MGKSPEIKLHQVFSLSEYGHRFSLSLCNVCRSDVWRFALFPYPCQINLIWYVQIDTCRTVLINCGSCVCPMESWSDASVGPCWYTWQSWIKLSGELICWDKMRVLIILKIKGSLFHWKWFIKKYFLDFWTFVSRKISGQRKIKSFFCKMSYGF